MKKTNLMLTTTLSMIIYCSALQAESSTGQFGIGVTSNNRFTVYQDGDNTFGIHPHLQYRGERFNILGDTMSYNFSNYDNVRFEVIGKTTSRGYEADNLDTLKGMTEREMSFDAGGRVALNTAMGMFSADVTADASGTHKGQTVDVRFGPDIYQQRWQGQRELDVSLLAGAKWESDEVVDYYYGVRANEATANRSVYEGKAAITPYIGLDAKMQLSPKFTLDGQVLYQHQPDEITNSPIVADDKTVTANVGLTYWFD